MTDKNHKWNTELFNTYFRRKITLTAALKSEKGGFDLRFICLTRPCKHNTCGAEGEILYFCTFVAEFGEENLKKTVFLRPIVLYIKHNVGGKYFKLLQMSAQA